MAGRIALAFSDVSRRGGALAAARTRGEDNLKM